MERRVYVTSGALAIGTTLGTIEQRELYAYQQIGNARQQVACRFVVGKESAGEFCRIGKQTGRDRW
jgi:hypothetical protein